MKIYTNTIDLAKPSSKQFWVAPYSKFGLGIKFVANGKKVDGECTLKYKTNNVKLTPSETKIDGYTIFIIDSSDANKQHVYTAECNGQKVDIIQNTTNSTVFEMNNINGVSNDDYYNALKQPFTIFIADYYEAYEALANVVFESGFIDETAPIKLEYRTVEKTVDGFIEATSNWQLFSNDYNDVNKFLPIDFTPNIVTGNKRGVQLRATDAGNGYFLNVKLGVDVEGNKLPYNVEGNIISLLDKTLNLDVVRDEQINYLFRDSYITDASGLILPPKVSERSYYGMFSASSLTKAPKLPATELADMCYDSMFSNCPSLEQAPELPATTLANLCYNSMFMNCKNLTKAPSILPATELPDGCYNYMFRDCYKLSQAPELPTVTTLGFGCYNDMIASCKSPFTFSNKTFDEVAILIQNEYLIGTSMWYTFDEYDIEEHINPIEIICSDKTMIATFDENEWTWVLTEK